jgi:hypothetical protein
LAITSLCWNKTKFVKQTKSSNKVITILSKYKWFYWIEVQFFNLYNVLYINNNFRLNENINYLLLVIEKPICGWEEIISRTFKERVKITNILLSGECLKGIFQPKNRLCLCGLCQTIMMGQFNNN